MSGDKDNTLPRTEGGSCRALSIAGELSALAILAGLVAYGLHRIRFGIDLMDEGHYLANPLRYILGDLPFRDEIQNALRSVDIVMWPLMKLLPGMGLYGWRVVGLVLFMAVSVSLYAFFRKGSNPVVVALACGASAFLGIGYWVPGYNQFATTFLVMSFCLWLWAAGREAKPFCIFLSVASGVLFFIGLLSYFPLVAMLCIPVFGILLSFLIKDGARSLCISSAVFVGTVFALVVVAICILYAAGLERDWLAAHRALASNQFHDDSFTCRVVLLVKKLRILVPHVLNFLGILALAACVLPRRGGARGIGVAVCVCLLVAWLVYTCVTRTPPHDNFFREIYHEPFLIASAAFALNVAALLMNYVFLGAGKGIYDLRRVLFGLAALLYFLVQSFVSSNSLLNGLYAVSPLFVLGAASLAEVLLRLHVADRISKFRLRSALACLCVLCLTLMALNLRHNFRNVYHDGNPKRMTARFSHPRLKGIRAEPHKVEAIEALLKYLDGRVKRGDYLFAYSDCPLIYFLTDTRPAVNCSWASGLFSFRVRERYVTYMEENNRQPEYCVRLMEQWPFGNKQSGGGGPLSYSTDPKVDPPNAYVTTHYTRVKTIPPFEVWMCR